MEGGVQLQEAPRALGESRGHDEEKEPLQSRADSPSAAQGLQFSSNTKKSDGSVPSRADSVLRLKQSRKSRLDPTRRMTTKKHDDLLTAIAVPRGYLDYWNARVDEAVCDFEETEELENAYKHQEQRLSPFRTSSTEWTINGAFGTLVFVMAWGPIVMAMGFIVGGLCGYAFSLAHDTFRLRRRQTVAKKQQRRIDQLMRWANYHFSTSQSQLQLIFKVVMEYQVLARLGGTSKTARSQLKLLWNFLSRDDVGQCLWLYLDYFLLNFRRMSRSEISMFFLVCQVCTQCVNSLRKRPPPVVSRMNLIMADEAVQNIFRSVKASGAWRKKPEAEKEENAILCADAGREVHRHVMKGGDLVQALRMDGTGSLGAVVSDTSQESHSKVQTSEDEGSGEDDALASFEGAEVAEIKANDLRPNTDFNVVLPGPGFDSSMARRSTLKQAPATSSRSFRSGRSGGTEGGVPLAAAAPEQEKEPPKTRRSTATDRKPNAPPRLFKSYEDLVNFDVKLKHQTPIGSYEFQFLEEKQAHDPSDPNWELTVDQTAIKVYKYNSPDSPVVLVKAYATLEGIPVNVLCHHIRHIPTRLKWDTTFGDYRVIEQDVDGCEMIYCLMKAPFPVSNRDFLQALACALMYRQNTKSPCSVVLFSKWRRTEEDVEANVTKMLMRSADHPSVPEKSGVVRAETLISGYIMEAQKDDSKSSTLFILAQTDVKGLIPKWVVNTTAARAPVGWVESLKKVCKAYMKQHGDYIPPYNAVA